MKIPRDISGTYLASVRLQLVKHFCSQIWIPHNLHSPYPHLQVVRCGKEGRGNSISTATLDQRPYEKLPSKARPVVIRSEAEYGRLLGIVKDLMDIPDETMSEEEGRLLELLGMVVEEYEDRVHPLPKVEPHVMLRYLLDEKRMKSSDLRHVLPRSWVSEIVS